METESALEWEESSGGGQVYSEDSLGEGREQFEGNEHRIFQSEDGTRAIKLTKPPNFGARGCLADYLDNLVLNNLFWGDDLRVEGLKRTYHGLQLIVSQPWIFSDPWEDEDKACEEVRKFLAEFGFMEIGRHTFRRANEIEGMSTLWDARPANILKDAATGILVPIDVHISAPPYILASAWEEQRLREQS